MIDVRRLVRGMSLQALYEIDLARHSPDDVLHFASALDIRQPDVRLLGYLALRARHQLTIPHGAPQDMFVALNMPPETRDRVHQVIIDMFTQDMLEDDITDEHIAELIRQEMVPEINADDLRFETDEDLLPLERQHMVHALVNGVIKHRQMLDDILQRHAPDWPIQQVAIIDRNILRLALYEFGIAQEAPWRVAIYEGVELAKLFGAEGSAAFVNGVLGTLMEQYDEIKAELGTYLKAYE
ncbi:MAG: transcription antitermination factor NusB [Anaerolineales bacterium]